MNNEQRSTGAARGSALRVAESGSDGPVSPLFRAGGILAELQAALEYEIEAYAAHRRWFGRHEGMAQKIRKLRASIASERREESRARNGESSDAREGGK